MKSINGKTEIVYVCAWIYAQAMAWDNNERISETREKRLTGTVYGSDWRLEGRIKLKVDL